MLKIKSRKKLLIPVCVMLLVIAMATSALAYSANYSFFILSSVTGPMEHSLSGDSSATITGSAETLDMDYSHSSIVSCFQSGIRKSGWISTKYSPSWDADMSFNSHTFPSNQLATGTYCIKVIKNDGHTTYVDGSGTLSQ